MGTMINTWSITMKVEFKVAMDAEQKKLGNAQTITLDVDFDGVDDDTIRKHAIANCVVGWQSQIRNHWTEYVDGKLPESIKFGDPLFTTARVKTRPMTDDEMIAYVKALPEEQQADMIDQMIGNTLENEIVGDDDEPPTSNY